MSTTNQEYLPGKLKKMQGASLTGGAIGLALMFLALLLNMEEFWQSYLIGWLFAFGLSMGGLLIVCVHNLAHGGWGYLVRRIGEAMAMTILPVMLLLLPIMMNLDALYPWAHENAANDALISSKFQYLNKEFMWGRYIAYIIIWAGAAFAFWTWSAKQDKTGDIAYRKKMRALAGPMALIYVLTVTFASVDYVMALEPKWFSSIYGVMLMSGHMLSVITFGIIFLVFLRQWEPVKTAFTINRQHDLGKLLFAFVVFWAYIELSQFLIYWHADITEEIVWYINRREGFFLGVTLLLFSLQFVIPFLVLLSRNTKRSAKGLVTVAAVLLVMRVVDLYWMVAPSIHHTKTVKDSFKLYNDPDPHLNLATPAMDALKFSGLEILSAVAFALIWFGLFLFFFRQRALIPSRDPFFSADAASKEAH